LLQDYEQFCDSVK